MMQTGTLRFQQVDVFTAVPFRGNPVAVALAADGTIRLGGSAVTCVEGALNLASR
jgi:predicted PhzF superfamily epimerase YddE/YHI9